MNKQQLRTKYKALRAALSEDQVETLSMEIANQLLQLPIWQSSFYHLFLSITAHKEVNTEYLLHILQGKDKNVVISKSNFADNTLAHYLLTDTTKLAINDWGIPEPVDGIPIPVAQLEVVFIPLLAYDTHGNRIGYGKGFYDRFLADCPENTLKIGLSFFDPETELLTVNELDIALDYCVTPTTSHTF